MPISERHQIAHLLRRAGFGASPAELDAYTALGFEGAVDRLINFEQVDDSAADNTAKQMRARGPAAASQAHPEFGNPGLEIAIWLTRMLLTKRPLQEKMTLFWHGHFTSSILDVKHASYMLGQNELYRQNALTQDFAALTKQVARDPAMLIYLNNNTNRKGQPNENWARELMELFTLGIGNYTETDVKESARAFTGWTVNRQGQFTANKNQHDTGSKVFMGHTGNFDGDNIIDIVLDQPAHPIFMARKLFRFFVYDDPDDATVARFADIYAKSGLNIRTLMQSLLLSPEFRADHAYYALIKSPTEFAVGALRTLAAHPETLTAWRPVEQSMAVMGQQLWAPPNVAGWPGNKAWINSTTFYARANLAEGLVLGNSAAANPLRIAQAAGAATPQGAVDYFLEALLQSDMPADYRTSLLSYMGNPSNKALDEKLQGLVRLIMSSPAYQLN